MRIKVGLPQRLWHHAGGVTDDVSAARNGQVMQQRGLEPALVDAAVQQARGSELERAQALWQRRFGSPGATPAERARQMRFLAGRGFGGDVIRRVVRGAPDDDEPPPADEPA